SGGAWADMNVPDHPAGADQLFGVTRAANGDGWAGGVVQTTFEATESARPIGVRPSAGAGAESPLAELGDQTGAVARSIAAAPSGPELRVAVTRSDGTGAVFRFDGAHWSAMTVPPPAGGATTWTLGAIGCSYTGIWYAAGSRGDATGRSVHRDRGAGWELLESTDLASLQFDGIGFDNRGEAWFACNRTSGDQLEGTVLQLHGDQFETMAVARKTGGAMQCFGIGFDVQGHGWVVGGRTPDEAFVAGTTGGACTEAL